MRGLSIAIVMQLRKMMTSTIWSNILWVMILLHPIRNLRSKNNLGINVKWLASKKIVYQQHFFFL